MNPTTSSGGLLTDTGEWRLRPGPAELVWPLITILVLCANVQTCNVPTEKNNEYTKKASK